MPKVPLQSSIKGIDIVTGEPATTGGPYASPNPVKPFNHPDAIEAQRRNKTGPFKDSSAPKEGFRGARTLEELKADERRKADAKAAQVNEARQAASKTQTPLTPGTQAAAAAPIKPAPIVPIHPAPVRTPQGMGKPVVAAQHVPTSTAKVPPSSPPAARVTPEDKTTVVETLKDASSIPVTIDPEVSNETGDTSKAGETTSGKAEDKGSEGA
ncbi:MAG TPA: hypothetical protein VGF75_08020 [Candidatus Saccharimonadales bacterium]|jgi:ribosomal protein L16/L10AE